MAEEERTMKELLLYLVSALVNQPNHVTIRESIGQQNIAYMVLVDAEDMPRVIGRSGRTANAIRIFLRAVGEVHGKSVWVEFNRHGAR
jgi:uncharacterized protein